MADKAWTGHRHRFSAEYLVPEWNHPSRQSPIIVSVFNILATVVGGGVLSLPYALSKAGWLMGLVMLVAGAVSSDVTLYVLCSCSRRSGQRSYTKIARECFGPRVEYVVQALLLAFLVLVITAYMLLLQDTVASLVAFVAGVSLNVVQKKWVLVGCVWLALPLCLCKTLHSLRYSCYLGFFSTIILTFCLLYKTAVINYKNPERLTHHVRALPASWVDAATVWPIFMLAFLCTFNILPVQSALVDPTRSRLKAVIHVSIASVAVLYTIISFAGYFYALDDTKDDILSNFASSDKLLMVARIGLALTLYFSLPLLVLPTREVSIELIQKAWRWCERHRRLAGRLTSCWYPIAGGESYPLMANGEGAHGNFATSAAAGGGGKRSAGAESEKQQKPAVVSTQDGAAAKEESGDGAHDTEGSDKLGALHRQNARREIYVESPSVRTSSHPALPAELWGVILHVGVTALLLMASYQLACNVSGVSFVWAVSGSTLGFLLGLILPVLFYLRIRWDKQHSRGRDLKNTCWVVLVVSVISTLVCTTMTILQTVRQQSS